MKGKKLLEFLILKPAFSSRNLSSLGLVLLFFIIYWLAGGKVTIPDVKQGSNFGSVTRAERNRQVEQQVERQVERQGERRGESYGSPVDEAKDAAPMSAQAKQRELEEKMQKLSELEERLKNLKRAKQSQE